VIETQETHIRGADVVDLRIVPVTLRGHGIDRDGRGNRFHAQTARIRYTRPGHGDAWLVDVTVSGLAVLRDGVTGSHERSARYGEGTLREVPDYLVDSIARYHPDRVLGWETPA
jgi:hypothetical protein